MRSFAEVTGLVLVAASLLLLGADMVSTLDDGGVFTCRSLADIWAMFDPSGPAAFLAKIPAPVGRLFVRLSGLYGWLVSGVGGVLLIFVAAPPGKAGRPAGDGR